MDDVGPRRHRDRRPHDDAGVGARHAGSPRWPRRAGVSSSGASPNHRGADRALRARRGRRRGRGRRGIEVSRRRSPRVATAGKETVMRLDLGSAVHRLRGRWCSAQSCGRPRTSTGTSRSGTCSAWPATTSSRNGPRCGSRPRRTCTPSARGPTGSRGSSTSSCVDGGQIDLDVAPKGELSLPVSRLSSGNVLEDRELQRRIDAPPFPDDRRSPHRDASDRPRRPLPRAGRCDVPWRHQLVRGGDDRRPASTSRPFSWTVGPRSTSATSGCSRRAS